MVRFDRTARGWLDTFPARGRLTLRGCIVLLVLALFPALAFADEPLSTSYSRDYAGQLAWCQAERAYVISAFHWSPSSCQLLDTGSLPNKYFFRVDLDGRNTLRNSQTFAVVPPPDDSACASTDPADAAGSNNFDGKILAGFSVCVQQRSADGSGAMVSCKRTLTVLAPPVWNPNRAGGTWTTYGTMSASSSLCSSNAPSGWADAGGSAASGTPAPPSPLIAAVSPPQICGGGSCYDPSSDQYCATSGGQQVCVKGDAGRSNAGACATSGDTAVCAGSPNAPRPPATTVPDPPTAIRSSDKTTQADKTTGQPVNVTTNVYSAPGTTTTSGQKPGDSGPANGNQPTQGNDPAHASSAGGNGTYSGGADCNSPPICTGDAVLCGIARQEWQHMCMGHSDSQQLHKDLAGEGLPTSTTLPGQSAVWSNGSTGDGVADAANQGNYNGAGFGYSTQCPLKDLSLSVMGKTVTVALADKCYVGDWIKALVLAFAFFFAARITAGGAK